jgi:hypothetical protein
MLPQKFHKFITQSLRAHIFSDYKVKDHSLEDKIAQHPHESRQIILLIYYTDNHRRILYHLFGLFESSVHGPPSAHIESVKLPDVFVVKFINIFQISYPCKAKIISTGNSIPKGFG